MNKDESFLEKFNFSQEIIEEFAGIGTERHIKKGEMLLEQGKSCSFIAYIVSGRLCLFHRQEEKEHTIQLKYKDFITDYS